LTTRPQLDLSRAGDRAEGCGHGRAERTRDFHHLPSDRGGGNHLGLPQLAPHQRQGIGDGRLARAISSGVADAGIRFRHLPGDQPRDE